MRLLFLGGLLGFLIGCQKPIEEPKAYLDSLLINAEAFNDGGFLYRVNTLPIDYFISRQLANQAGSQSADRDKARESAMNQYGGGNYYLLRMGLDSASVGSPGAQSDLENKMMLLQSNQELARQEIIGHLPSGKNITPDIFFVDADWISKSGVTVLFGFRKDVSKRMQRIEFGKSFVYSRNQSVAVHDLEPKFRLKG